MVNGDARLHEGSGSDQARVNRFLLVALPIGHLVNDWPGAALWVLAPAIALSMGLGPVEVGLLITIHSAGASLAYLPAGLIGDTFRNRGNLLAATFWWVAVGYLVASSASSFWLIAILLGIAGLGDAAWHPLATGVMVKQMPGRRARVLGVHAIGGTLAEVGAPLCAGLMLAWFEWQTVLQVSVLPALLMGIVFLKVKRWVPDSSEQRVTKSDLGAMVRIWLQPQGLRTLGIIVFYNMALMGAMAMMPLYLINTYDLSAAETGMVIAVTWLIGAIAQPILGHLSDVAGRKVITAVGLSIAALLIVCAGYVDPLPWVIVCFALSLGALVSIRAVLLAAMVDVSGRRETTTLGFAFAVMDGVGALGALFAGTMAQYDMRFAFVFAGMMAVSAMILTLFHRFSGAIRQPELSAS